MSTGAAIGLGPYSHELLLHETDGQLVRATRDFVGQGLAAGGQVLVHSSAAKVNMLRTALGTHPRLDYGLDEELYGAPTSTLFRYQRSMAESTGKAEVWVTGTVPLGRDVEAQAGWTRYESMVNTALSDYAFHALCTYDMRTLPATVIAGARATHPHVRRGRVTSVSAEFADPASFLADPLARTPQPPAGAAACTLTVTDLDHLARVRARTRLTAREGSALLRDEIEDLVIAVNEVTANGLVHGSGPVRLSVWSELATVTCLVTDAGGGLDPLTGVRYPHDWGPMGLWAARQLVDDLIIGPAADGGCAVLLRKESSCS